MSEAKAIRNYIETLNEGEIFTCKNLPFSPLSVTVELCKLNKTGIIQKISKGRYYKPKLSIFGALKPKDDEIIKSYTDNQTSGYVTGIALYNSFGLTTQVTSKIEIASNRVSPLTQITKNLSLEFIPSKVKISNSNVPLLKLLDLLKYLDKAPDVSIEAVLTMVKEEINKLDLLKQKRLITLAKSYSPKIRALLGALLQDMGKWDMAFVLKETLNPLTKYKLNIDAKILPSKEKWRII